jgi:GTP-binding protein
MFIDCAQISVKAGDGGSGIIAFRREKYVPKGGPSGGDGGKGGDILVIADRHLHTLLDFKYKNRYSADNGRPGQGDNKTGKSGADTVIRLPIGTFIRDVDSGEIVADLVEDGQKAIIARGGKGGLGNARFATSTDQAPRRYTVGYEGEERLLDLELKLIADVGFVGLPNAGKSTLLSRISAARPKIADYPFTTLTPNLGIVKLGEGKSFVAADIPGLIEGAHEGKGLGITFLRHIERTKLIVMLLDATSDDLQQDFEILTHELLSYDIGLREKSQIIVYTKADLVGEKFDPLAPQIIKNRQSILISSVRGDGIDELLARLWDVLQEIDHLK